MGRLATVALVCALFPTLQVVPPAPAHARQAESGVAAAESGQVPSDQPVAVPAPAQPEGTAVAPSPSSPDVLTPELLRQHFLVQLPAHFGLSAFDVTALVNLGTTSEPLYKARFDATVELRTATLEEIGRTGPVTWLEVVGRPGDRARLYGTATAVRVGDGPWQVEFALELNPLPRLGQPRELFPGDTVVRGSEDEQGFLGRLAAIARDRLALELPGYWALDSFEFGESAILDDRIALRFAADLSLREPTFAEKERDGETVVVTPVAEAGTTRRLVGRFLFRHEEGRWQVDLEPENDPASALGLPLGFFEGRVLVEGSEEEKAFREAQHRRQLEEMRRQQEIEEEKRKAELAAAEHARRLEEQKRAEEEAQRQARMAELARELRGHLAVGLPGFWKAGEPTLSEVLEREDGSLEFAFSAPLELSEDTFVEKGREADVVLLSRVASAGEVRTLHGKAIARREGEVWRFEIRADNNPLEGTGLPLGFFEGRVLVEGSEEEKAFREAQHRRQLEEMRRQQEIEEEKRKAELAALAHREKVSEAERQRREAEERELREQIAQALRERFALGLPGFWKVEGFDFRELVEDGPNGWRVAFTASLALGSDTFEEAGREEGVVLLRPVAKAGEKRQLHGKALARRNGEEWAFEIEVDNNPVAALGQPVDFFEGKVLVEGSEEEKAFREAQHRRQLEEMRRQQEIEEQKRQAELAEARHRNLLEEERQKLELAKIQFEERLDRERAAREAAKRQRELEQREREIAAVRAALQSTDIATRAAALDAAIKSGDTSLRQLALHEWLKRTTRVALQIEAADEAGRKAINSGITSFALDFAHFDETSGAFTGQVVAPGRNPPADMQFSGRVTGEAISVASRVCQTTLRLGEDPVLRGELRCGGLLDPPFGSERSGIFRVSVPLQ